MFTFASVYVQGGAEVYLLNCTLGIGSFSKLNGIARGT